VIQLSDWARDLLISRGALVEGEGEGVVRALVPPDVSAKLSVSDWLSLDFGTRVGADDPAEWMDRLSALLPPSPAVAGVRLRMRAPTQRIDADAILNRELVVQNGVWRLWKITPAPRHITCSRFSTPWSPTSAPSVTPAFA
jgi:hypothetical protein